MQEIPPTDFDVVAEPWNKYFAEGHGTIKTKFVLIRLSFQDGPEPLIGFKSKDLADLIPVSSNKGTPDKQNYNALELSQYVTERDIQFTPLKPEEWSIYKVGKRQIHFRLTLVQVNKTDKFDSIGDPIYLVNTQPIIKII